ncbi:MAG: helix-turn-helix domain-containing protein [Patescibacteria group bacterium]
MDNLKDRMLSISEAASYLGVSEMTLRRWHDSGKLKATMLTPGGQRRYSISDLQKIKKGLFRIAHDWASSAEAYEPDDEFYCPTSDVFKTRHTKMAILLDQASVGFQPSLISSAAGEIGNNSFDHNLGNWPDISGAFFSYDLNKRIIVIADRGVGVLATLQKVQPDLQTHEQALNVAFTKIVSGRAPENRGNGLKFAKDALTQAKAELFFQSGDAVLEISKKSGELKIHKSDDFIRGALSIIKF